MDCDLIEQEGAAEAYLGGRLAPDRREAFEAHAFGCPRCLETLRVLQAVQAELWEQGSPAPAKALGRRPAPARRWALASVAALFLVAAGAIVIWRHGGFPGRTGSVDRSRALHALSEFEPPLYLPATLRAGEGEAAERFRLGMEQYQAGAYDRAIKELAVAERFDPQAPQIAFFLGVCNLLTGRTDPGITLLQKTVSFGDTPYLLEARFYLAKGFLRKGDAMRAAAQLDIVAASRGPQAEEAARLLAAIATSPGR
jgi:tetratricopeptide (TPR) repeat protein